MSQHPVPSPSCVSRVQQGGFSSQTPSLGTPRSPPPQPNPNSSPGSPGNRSPARTAACPGSPAPSPPPRLPPPSDPSLHHHRPVDPATAAAASAQRPRPHTPGDIQHPNLSGTSTPGFSPRWGWTPPMLGTRSSPGGALALPIPNTARGPWAVGTSPAGWWGGRGCLGALGHGVRSRERRWVGVWGGCTQGTSCEGCRDTLPPPAPAWGSSAADPKG